MKFIPILILSFLLTSCALFKKDEILPISPKAVIHLDSEVLQPCALLKEDIIILTFEDSLTEYGNLATSYSICAKKQNNSIKLLKQFAGEKK